MHRRLMALALVVVACRGPAATPPAAPDPASLRERIAAQFERAARDWNRGDLDAFMADYAPDTIPTFVSGGHVHRGYDYIRGRYAPLFRPGASRDSLRFEELDVRPLAPTLALVTARWILYRGDSVTSSGPFTLVMEQRDQAWKILHDHSSSDSE